MVDRESVSELRKELQALECSLQERERLLEQRRSTVRSLNTEISELHDSLSTSEVSRHSSQREYRTAARNKQIFENEERCFRCPSSSHTREELISQLMEEEDKQKMAQEEVRGLSTRINAMRETEPDPQKRLTVVRLLTMLEGLRASLAAKVNSSHEEEDDEEHAQELLKVIQELSRERERAFSQITKKEREMIGTIQLKKKRIEDLKREADRNVGALRQSNDYELLGIVERIQCERQDLMNDIERIQETNSHLSRIIRDVKLSAGGATKDRGNALSADDTMGTSQNPDEEMKELREKIAAASAEKKRLLDQTNAIATRIDSDAEKHHVRMAQLKKELLHYQEECSCIEKEIKALKDVCDSLAVTLQS